MFNWDPTKGPVRVPLPFEIYWGVTGPATLILAIGLLVMNHPGWVCAIVEGMPDGRLKRWVQKTNAYITCKESRDEQKKVEHESHQGNNKKGDVEANGTVIEMGNMS